MITPEGFTKEIIQSEAIVITFGQSMMKDHGGIKKFLKYFEEVMKDENMHWLHKCKNKPKLENFMYVYIIVANRLYGRVFYSHHEKAATTAGMANGTSRSIEWSRLVLHGPLERCPIKRTLKGFQGFRYCTELWESSSNQGYTF